MHFDMQYLHKTRCQTVCIKIIKGRAPQHVVLALLSNFLSQRLIHLSTYRTYTTVHENPRAELVLSTDQRQLMWGALSLTECRYILGIWNHPSSTQKSNSQRLRLYFLSADRIFGQYLICTIIHFYSISCTLIATIKDLQRFVIFAHISQ